MSATIYSVNRAGWPTGEWDSEPDRLDFVHASFACLLLRNDMGAWCGYVGVPETHPAFGLDYDNVTADVHGGLTYSNVCRPPICHEPQNGMPDKVWWLGFDTAHFQDLVPGMWQFHSASHGHYRNIEYTRHETEQLAEQLAAQKN